MLSDPMWDVIHAVHDVQREIAFIRDTGGITTRESSCMAALEKDLQAFLEEVDE